MGCFNRHSWIAKCPLKFPKWRWLGVDVVLENQLTGSIAPDLNQCINQSMNESINASINQCINQSINWKEVQPRQAEGRKDSKILLAEPAWPLSQGLSEFALNFPLALPSFPHPLTGSLKMWISSTTFHYRSKWTEVCLLLVPAPILSI